MAECHQHHHQHLNANSKPNEPLVQGEKAKTQVQQIQAQQNYQP